MIPKPFNDMTRRIGNLMMCHKYGIIGPEVYGRELEAIQGEFLTPPAGTGPENDHGKKLFDN